MRFAQTYAMAYDEPMSEKETPQKVMVEIELAAPSQEADGPFECLIKVRIISAERHAYETMKETVLLAIEAALGDSDELEEIPEEPMH
jgi:hypothetical protein